MATYVFVFPAMWLCLAGESTYLWHSSTLYLPVCARPVQRDVLSRCLATTNTSIIWHDVGCPSLARLQQGWCTVLPHVCL